MTDDVRTIHNYFAQLGLEPEIAKLYLALHRHGAQSISELARTSHIERTRIYRLLDTLRASGLVEVEVQYRRSILRASPVENLQIILSKKEEELQGLREGLAEVQHVLRHHDDALNPTKVQYYKGIEGMKQMMWNQTKSKTENLALLYENMQTGTSSAFFERWVQACNARGIVHRGLIGDHFIETQKKWYSRKDNERVRLWEARYVPASLFAITQSMVIYNDVVAYYSWRDDNMFGVELHNKQTADMQRAFFEMLWGQAQAISKQVSQQLSTPNA